MRCMRYRGFQCQRAGVVETDSHRLERIGRDRVHRQKAVTPYQHILGVLPKTSEIALPSRPYRSSRAMRRSSRSNASFRFSREVA